MDAFNPLPSPAALRSTFAVESGISKSCGTDEAVEASQIKTSLGPEPEGELRVGPPPFLYQLIEIITLIPPYLLGHINKRTTKRRKVIC